MPIEHVAAVAHCHCCNLWRVLSHLAVDKLSLTFCACVNITPAEAGQGIVSYSRSFGSGCSWNS